MRYLLIIFLILPFSLFSQTSKPESEFKTTSIGIVPQYSIINGIRVDFDLKLNNKENHRFVAAPQFYVSTRDGALWNYNSMYGAGLELQHKIYLKKESNSKAAYFAYGPVFNFFSVKDDGLTIQEFVDNGGTFIGLVEQEMTTNIFRIGGNFIFGIRLVILDNLYIDPYAGVGIRFSFDNKVPGLHNYYNDWWGDMGYSGTIMVGGIRIGVIF